MGRLPLTQSAHSGLAIIWIDMDYFLGENGILTALKEREAALVNKNGEIVFSTSDNLRIDTEKKAQGSYEEDGRIISFVSLENVDWYGVISTPRTVTLKRLFNLRLLIYLGIFLCLICGGASVVFLLRYNYSPLQELAERFTSKNEKTKENPEVNVYNVLNNNISQILEQVSRMEETVGKQNKSLRDAYLFRLLVGQYNPEMLEEPPAFVSKSFAVVLFETANIDQLFPDTDMTPENRRQTARFIITNVMEELIGERHCGYVIPYREYLAAIISLAPDDTAGNASVAEIVKRGIDEIYKHFQLTVWAGLSGVHKSYYGIYECCREAEKIMEYADFPEKPEVIRLCDVRSANSYCYPQEMEAQLTKAVVARDFPTAEAVLNEILEQNQMDKGRMRSGNKCLLMCITATLLRAAGGDARYTSETVRILEDTGGWQQIKQRLLSLAEEICGESAAPKSHASSLADRVRTYLDEHYSDSNVSIQLLGDYFSMSPYYLSKIFKQEFGSSFGDYLRYVRVEHVKVLLEQETSIRLADAAAKAGFSDARALKRAFLQEVGILPSEYMGRIKSK